MVLKLCVATPGSVVLVFQRRRTKSKLSAVLLIELITSAVLSLHQETVIVQVQSF